MADERRLIQILVNLLSNAIKFTEKGGKVALHVVTQRAQQEINFIVVDTGIGISKEDQAKLFQPFVQVESSLSRRYEGTGLGLALVRHLTELHGGRVSVQSEAGKGSTFMVTLPWQESRAASAPSPSDNPSASKGIRAEKKEPLRILLVDDNENSQEAIGSFLSAHAFRVLTATNGLDAVKQATQYTPDVILMDIQMAEMDGLQATRLIRKDMRMRNVPIIALTALAMPGDRERCLEAGITEYLAKPIGLRQLIQVIEGYFPPGGSGTMPPQ